MECKVSVLMSFYNEDLKFLKIAVESILSQTYKDFQFVIVSDNPDNSQLNDYIINLSLKESRLLFIQNKLNMGLTKSLNIGLKHCTGRYIVRMDADDYSFPDRIEKQLMFMEKHPELVASGTFAELMDENNKVIGKMQTSPDLKYLRALFPFRTPIYHPSAIIRREISGVPISYDENYIYSQDYALWFKLINMGISNINEYLIRYRLSKKQISSLYKDKIRDLDLKIRTESLLKYYKISDKTDANIIINLFYDNLSSLDNKAIQAALSRLRICNIDNPQIDLDSSLLFLFRVYCKFLASNFSVLNSVVNAIKMQFILHVKSLRPIMSILKYKISNIHVQS